MNSYFDGIASFFENNHEWVFSGIGVVILSGLISFLLIKKRSGKYESGSNISHDIKTGPINASGDVNINIAAGEINKYINHLKDRPDIVENRNYGILNETQKRILEEISNSPVKLNALRKRLGFTNQLLENLLRPMINEGIIEMKSDYVIWIDRE